MLDSTVIPSNNVYVRIAPIYANYYYPINDDIKNFKSKGIIDNWGKLTKNLMLWTYHTHFGSLYSYFPTMHTWQQSFNYYKDEQVKFLYMQSNSTEIADWKARMETYIASKMLWNPNRDVLQLRNEYIDIYYGVASSYIKRFMDSLDEHYCNVFNNYNVYNQCQGSEIIISKYHTAAFFENLINTVEDAEKSVSESSLSSNEKQVLLKRLEQVKITPMYMLLINYDSYYSNSIKKDAFVKKFFEICDRNKIVRFKEGQPYADFKAQYIV